MTEQERREAMEDVIRADYTDTGRDVTGVEWCEYPIVEIDYVTHLELDSEWHFFLAALALSDERVEKAARVAALHAHDGALSAAGSVRRGDAYWQAPHEIIADAVAKAVDRGN